MLFPVYWSVTNVDNDEEELVLDVNAHDAGMMIDIMSMEGH